MIIFRIAEFLFTSRVNTILTTRQQTQRFSHAYFIEALFVAHQPILFKIIDMC